MGLFTGLLTWPLAPVRGVVWIAERVQEQAEEQYYDPATIRRRLEDVEEARSSGELSEEEAAEIEDALLARLMEGRRIGRGGADGGGG